MDMSEQPTRGAGEGTPKTKGKAPRELKMDSRGLLLLPIVTMIGLIASSMMAQQRLRELSAPLGWSTYSLYGPQSYQLQVRQANRYCLEDALKHPDKTRVQNIVVQVPTSTGQISDQALIQLSSISGASFQPAPALDGRSTLNFGGAWGACPSTISAIAPGSKGKRAEEPQQNAQPTAPQDRSIPISPGVPGR